MRLKSIIAVGTVLTCSTLLWGCGNTNMNQASEQTDTVQSESWNDPKRLEASHLEALERMEKDHIHRMVSLNASMDGDKVMTTLERSSQKLEEMRPLAEMLQHEGHPTLLQRIQDMSGDIQGSKQVVAEMKDLPQDGKIKIQSENSDSLHHISSFRDYHQYMQEKIQTLNKAKSATH
ncbi:hypothetical protein JNUCC31_20070 [Paenibacillus sp. JNUCC31]|uniref:hypothetical protein n=1 Tax=Paenibacillus sp. JNUCC-31 TaxID=2777983 RepID=UPI00177AABE3|nr:hypothetical protein [Paenibacillus sp. JNUCC-31]QOS77104.1 hypothetical protein JNUCC31_20070 [Paenibacillus sp. JNUCC-31]